MRRQLAIPIAAALAAALLAQDGGDITIQQRVDEVIAPTTVLDKDGSYITGLKPMEFKLYDNDKPQTIKVEEVISPVSLVVAILSRGIAGTCGNCVILNLPGSPKGARESIESVLNVIPHIVDLLKGKTEHGNSQ